MNLDDPGHANADTVRPPASSRSRTSSTVLREAGDPRTIDWDEIHDVVQARFATLCERVRATEPGAAWAEGRTSAPAFPLFSYRSFERLGRDDDDPIVIGLTIARAPGGYRVDGDISGEESGRVEFDAGCPEPVADDHGAVVDAARRVADRLAAQDRLLIGLLRAVPPNPSE